MKCCMRAINKNRNESSFMQYLPFFWPVWQSKACVEPKLGQGQLQSQKPSLVRPVTKYIHQLISDKHVYE